MNDKEFQAKVYESLNGISNTAAGITGNPDNHIRAVAIMNEVQALIHALEERANAPDDSEETA
ncbi:hypothetical protein FACS18948_5300 [Clostridia bacterium]|nr:hypothetical protein FACS18948_5300 [Clostridia bacterium]